MEKFATLTCSRGDRPQFLNFCRKQIDRFTTQPAHRIFVTEPPKSDQPDLTRRILNGLVAAKNFGIDVVMIIEDDDFYDEYHTELLSFVMEKGYDFVGASKSLYYNLKNGTYQEFSHPGRSSLFCTAFRISALDKFVWPSDDTVFLDLQLWKYAQQRRNFYLLDYPVGVGIKHGVGKTAGAGHRMVMQNQDNNHAFLRLKVGEEAYKFYSSL